MEDGFERDMITVNIAHYDRPYILELNVLLLRHFLGDRVQIVVADDGSYDRVIDKIKTFPVNDIYTNPKHTKTSFGDTMRGAIDLCKTDLYMFCEDDFIYMQSPIQAELNTESPTYQSFPDVKPGDDKKDSFGVTEQIFKDMPDVGLVKFQVHYRMMRRMHRKEFPRERINGFDFFVSEVNESLCNSWPYVIRQEVAKRELYFAGSLVNVHDRQGYVKRALKEKFIREKKKVLTFIPGRFLHVGNGISVNVTKSGSDQARKNRSANLQDSLKIGNQKYYKFARYLTEEYCNGRFRIDVDEVLSEGVNKAFSTAFNRIK